MREDLTEMLRPAAEITVSQNLSLMQAIETLERSTIKILFVVDGDNKLVGTCTDGDICRAILRAGGAVGQVSDVMNASPVKLLQGFNPGDVSELMRKHDISVLPVVDDHGRVQAW